jgi:uncharacterized protein (DUF433 family)
MVSRAQSRAQIRPAGDRQRITRNWELGLFRNGRHPGLIHTLAYSGARAYERITIDPNRMSGLACIRDTRVTVSAVFGQLAAGRSFEEVLADYPYLERADILAALEFAAAAVQERELPLARPA